MNLRHIPALVAFLIVALLASWSPALQAQGPSALVGSWERVSLKGSAGAVTQPPAPAAFLIFGADGFFSQTAIPTGRPKLDKPVEQMTKEELVARFQQLEARRGTYTVAGNKLTRRNVSSVTPQQEATEQTQAFRIEGGMLILTSTTPGNQAEARFRRAK